MYAAAAILLAGLGALPFLQSSPAGDIAESIEEPATDSTATSAHLFGQGDIEKFTPVRPESNQMPFVDLALPPTPVAEPEVARPVAPPKIVKVATPPPSLPQQYSSLVDESPDRNSEAISSQNHTAFRQPIMQSAEVPTQVAAPLSLPPSSANTNNATANLGPAKIVRHRVIDGDTLENIAQRYLGDSGKANEILELNRDQIRDPAFLRLGVVLRIVQRGP